MSDIDSVKNGLKKNPKKWLVTGVAGFIGSNILEELLDLGQIVVGLDNFSTGKSENLDYVKEKTEPLKWKNFTFFNYDIKNIQDCITACKGIDYVLHQAALGSVPRSIEDPVTTNMSNINGFLNMLIAARDSDVKRFVYAASSSTYGDHPDLPKVEDKIGRPLSPYAVTKYVNELYADVFATSYGTQSIGLRYFNIFGKRQDPEGAYAAVIPKWINTLLNGESPVINGDGETSRDYCHVKNAVYANLLAATTDNKEAVNKVYNIACCHQTTLNELLSLIKKYLIPFKPEIGNIKPAYGSFRKGDVRHSLADISRAEKLLGYFPIYDVTKGMEKTIDWFMKK